MKRPDRIWEVLIINATGRDDDSDRLREELVRRGLRVRLERVAERDSEILMVRITQDAERADYCVLLMPDRERPRIEDAVAFEFLAIPRRSLTQVPGADEFTGSYLSVGQLSGSADVLADRIAGFLEFVGKHSHGQYGA